MRGEMLEDKGKKKDLKSFKKARDSREKNSSGVCVTYIDCLGEYTLLWSSPQLSSLHKKRK